LASAEVAGAPNNFALSMAPRTRLSEHVNKPSPMLLLMGDASLSLALLAFDDVFGAVRARSPAVRTGNLLLNHHLHRLPQIQVAQAQQQLYLQFGAFQCVEVVLVVHHRVVHFLSANAVVQKLLIAVVQHFVS
jgi:hypothetical protein